LPVPPQDPGDGNGSAPQQMEGRPRLSIMHVLERPPARAGAATARAASRAGLADTDDHDLRPQRLEAVALLEVLLELGDQLCLDVQDAAARLADRVLMSLGRDLVVDGPIPEPDRVQRAGRGQRLQRAVDGAAGDAGLRALQLGADLVRRAVT